MAAGGCLFYGAFPLPCNCCALKCYLPATFSLLLLKHSSHPSAVFSLRQPLPVSFIPAFHLYRRYYTCISQNFLFLYMTWHSLHGLISCCFALHAAS